MPALLLPSLYIFNILALEKPVRDVSNAEKNDPKSIITIKRITEKAKDIWMHLYANIAKF